MADKNSNGNKNDDKKIYLVLFPILIILIIASFLLYSYFENKSDDTMEYSKKGSRRNKNGDRKYKAYCNYER